MSAWYWRVFALKAAFVLTCLASYLRADDNIQKLPFCNPVDPTSNNDLMIISTLDGKLSAFSTQTGIKAWQIETQPLLSSNLHHVELTAGGKWVRLVPSLRGTLYSLSGETIEPLPFDAEQLLSSSFKYSDDLVIAGARETLWLGIDTSSGGVVYECGTGGCSSEQQTASAGRDLIVLRRHSNTVRALDPRSGNEKWNFSVAEHQLALSRRECVGANSGPASAVAVSVAVALPEGVVAIRRPGERQPLWQQKLEAPVAGMWRLHGGALQHIDVLWEATQSLDGGLAAPPSLYIGVHDTQLYIQESVFYAQKLETAVSTKPVPWKLMTSRPLIEGGDTALTQLQNSDPNTLSLITLYGNTGQIGNHGFFLYLQETCDQAVQVSEEALDGSESLPSPGQSGTEEHHHVHVHVYSLWFWWKEVLLIAVSSALLMNLMIWPRFFAPKMSSSSPLPISNQEFIFVENHYERPTTSAATVHRSRYKDDFTELRCLGRGGFGVVFEAKNKIDECSYAVKRITLPKRESQRERVLREVKVLAKLEHENIVRFFNAWVEEPAPAPRGSNHDEPASCEAADVSSSRLLTDDYSQYPPSVRNTKDGSVLLNIQKPVDDCVDALYYDKKSPELSKRHRSLSCSDSISIVFDENAAKHSVASKCPSIGHTLSQHSDNEDSFIVFEEPTGEHDNTVERVKEESKTDSRRKKKGHKRHWSLDMCVRDGGGGKQAPGCKMYLYIQMQLCRRDSLKNWLENNRSWQSRRDKVKELFRQIVLAVEYIHGEGLIHRDLKPSNILFGPDERIKVGDFGLVTAMSEYSQDGQPPARDGFHIHTHQVGTKTYMSPEQLLGRPYGFKVDIYSLGLILFELLHPFQTETERAYLFQDAKSGRYPQDFLHSHPKEVEVLKLMLSEDPAARPTAAGVRARAPLFEPTDESSQSEMIVKWFLHKNDPNRGYKLRAGPNPMETNKDSSLPHRTDAEQKIATEKMDNQFERQVAKKIKISDVLKMLRNRSVEDNQCAVMSSFSNELLQYLIDRVNNKQTEKSIDDKYLNPLTKFAVTLHFYSPQTYSNLRSKFDLCLPNRCIISQWHLRSTSAPGITLQSVQKIKTLDSGKDSFICLSFYESRIREHTERDSERYHGYVNIGNDLYGDFVDIANEALVVTAKSFSSFWELPIAYFFGRNFSGTQKTVLLKLCIDALTFQNIRVGCVIVDGTPTNVNMASVLGANVAVPPYVPHFTYKGAKYYLIIKPSFLSKLAKNLFATERLLFHENEMIDYKYVVNYFMKKYTFNERQITDRELWNNVTATGIEFVQKESQSQNINCIPTVTFIRNFSNLLCFCKSITNPWRRRCDAESQRECYMLCNYIRNIKLSDGDFVVDSPRTLAFSGSLYNVHALERLYADYILSGKLKYILPYDCPPISLVESHFDLSRLSDYITARQVSCLYNQFLYCCGVYKSKEEEAYDLNFPPLLRAVTESSVSITPHETEQSGDMRGRS